METNVIAFIIIFCLFFGLLFFITDETPFYLINKIRRWFTRRINQITFFIEYNLNQVMIILRREFND